MESQNDLNNSVWKAIADIPKSYQKRNNKRTRDWAQQADARIGSEEVIFEAVLNDIYVKSSFELSNHQNGNSGSEKQSTLAHRWWGKLSRNVTTWTELYRQIQEWIAKINCQVKAEKQRSGTQKIRLQKQISWQPDTSSSKRMAGYHFTVGIGSFNGMPSKMFPESQFSPEVLLNSGDNGQLRTGLPKLSQEHKVTNQGTEKWRT